MDNECKNCPNSTGVCASLGILDAKAESNAKCAMYGKDLNNPKNLALLCERIMNNKGFIYTSDENK